jgi:cold shock CspA family protein
MRDDAADVTVSPDTACNRSRVHMQRPGPSPKAGKRISSWEPARLKWLNHEKGFGFLTRPGASDVHVFLGTLVAAGLGSIKPKQRLLVRWRMEPRGPHAMYVRSAYGKQKKTRHAG